MVRGTECPECGIAMSNCFGRTGNRHKPECPYNDTRRC